MRGAGLSVQMHAGNSEGLGSMKSQFKKADASGARFAAIFGAEELESACITIKSLRDGEGHQFRQRLDQISVWASTLQSGY